MSFAKQMLCSKYYVYLEGVIFKTLSIPRVFSISGFCLLVCLFVCYVQSMPREITNGLLFLNSYIYTT